MLINISLACRGSLQQSPMYIVVKYRPVWTALGWVTTRVLDDEYKPTVLTVIPDIPNDPFFRGSSNKNK